MAEDRTYKEAQTDVELVPGVPSGNEEQITGNEVIGATSATNKNAGVTFTNLKTWVQMDASYMSKAVYDTDANNIVDKSESVDDGAGNVKTAAEIKGHIDDPVPHREINDGAPTATTLWSSTKISAELALKANESAYQAHVGDTTIHAPLNDNTTTATNVWSATKIDGQLALKNDITAFDAHANNAQIHAALNDLIITTSNVWSATKINTELGLKANQSALDSHTGTLSIHRTLDDTTTSTTNLWSASKISAEIALKTDLTTFNAHVANSSHLSGDERNALTNASPAPNAANPIATMANIVAGSRHVIQDEGLNLPDRARLNFTGSGVTATDNLSQDRTDVTISADVVGPAGSVDNRVVLFSGTTGKLIKTSLVLEADLLTNAADQFSGFPEKTLVEDADRFLLENSVAAFAKAYVAGNKLPLSPVGGLNLSYDFSTNTTASDPGSGQVKVNNADLSAATAIYVSATTAFGTGASPAWSAWRQNDYIGIWDETNRDGRWYQITGALTDNTGWYTIPVAALSGGTSSIGNGRRCRTLMVEDPVSRVTADQKAGLDAASPAITGANAVATMANIGGASKHVIQDEGTPLTARANLNFIGSAVTASDNAGNDATDVTITVTVNWGDIGGTLSNQTDLQTELNAKIGPSGVTFENLNANGDVGTGATQVAQGNHLHTGVYDPSGSAQTVQTNLDTHAADFSLHLTSDQNAGMDAASPPITGANPVATNASAEADLGAPAQDGYVLSSTVGKVRSWVPLSTPDLTNAVFPTYAVFDAIVVGAAAIDFASGNKQRVDASTHNSVTVTAPAGRPANFMLTILNSGSLTSIAPAAGGSILWGNSTVPTWAGRSELALYYDGTSWIGSAVVNVG